MSTNNFNYKNICVVVHDDIDDDYPFINEDIDSWKEILNDKIKNFQIPYKNIWVKDGLVLGNVDFYKKNGEHYATIYATYKCGYYAGACLDYIVEYEDDSWGDEVRLKTLDKKIENKCRAIEKVLRTFGTEVRKVGQFSNGEAVYEKVKKS